MPDEKIVNRETLKAVRQRLQKKIEDGAIIAGQALTSKAINPISEESGAIQETPFIIQGTATTNNTSPMVDTSSVGKQLEKQGNSVVYNQLLDIVQTPSESRNGVTFTNNNDGTWTVNGTATGGSAYSLIIYNLSYIAGHTYLLKGNPGGGSESTFYLCDNYLGQYHNKDYGNGVIFTPTQDVTPVSIAVRVMEGTTVNNLIFKPKLIDLSIWFNSDIPADLLSYPEHFSWHYDDDLPYNAGEIRNSNGRYLECGQGRNIYNPAETYNRVIPNIEYYYYGGSATTITYYDKNQNVISSESVNSGNTFTIPSNCWYINSSVTSTITISEYYSIGEGYNKYYPYVSPVIYDTGTEVLSSARNIRDKKIPSGMITRYVGSYTFTGNEEFSAYGAAYYWLDGQTTIGAKLGTINILCDNLIRVSAATDVRTTPGIFFHSNGRIYLTYSAQEMAGHTIYFELAIPWAEPGTAFSENIQLHDYSYQAWRDTNNNYTSIPQGTKLFYPADYVSFADSLYSYTAGDVQVLAKKSDLPQVLYGSTAPINSTVGTFGQIYIETTTNKVYQCTAVTPQGTTPETYTYNWVELTGGGSGSSNLYKHTLAVNDGGNYWEILNVVFYSTSNTPITISNIISRVSEILGAVGYAEDIGAGTYAGMCQFMDAYIAGGVLHAWFQGYSNMYYIDFVVEEIFDTVTQV